MDKGATTAPSFGIAATTVVRAPPERASPVSREQLIRRLTDTFLEEIAEHVHVFNVQARSLERSLEPAPRALALQALFRSAHSLKGAARVVRATAIESVAHRLEELLQGVRERRRDLDAELLDVLFAAAAALARAGQCIAESAPTEAALAGVSRRLEQALRAGA